MKIKYLLLLIAFFASANAHAQNIFPSTGSAGIGTTTPDASAILEVKSITQGILIPRMPRVRRDAIVSPATGLMIYQTSGITGFYYYDGTAWTAVTPRPGWSLTGNSGTDTATNFIGTTDSMPLVFKLNNQNAGILDLKNANTALGYKSLYSNISGSNNVAIGNAALYYSKDKNNLVALGDSALYINGFSATGTSQATENTAIGAKALKSNDIGVGNTAVGYRALTVNTVGIYNTAIGDAALVLNETGSGNTAVGALSLSVNATGHDNTAVGQGSISANKAGIENTAVGVSSLYSNETGNGNTTIGVASLFNNISGYSNIGIGNCALFNNAFNSNIVAVGDSALYNNGKNAVLGSFDANSNVAVGSKALFNNNRGRANSAFGFQASYMNTTGIHNTSCGYWALYHNITGSNNTTLGYGADVSTGALSNSIAIGSGASVSLSNCIMLGNAAVTKLGIGITPSSTNIIQFSVTTAKLTTGGVWTNASDKKLKDQFQKLENNNILDKINQLDIQRWHYKADSGRITHIGPVAQDFYKLFGVGDDTTISTIDPSGVALLGIQALSKQNDRLKSENDSLKSEITQIKSMMQSLQQQFNSCNPCARTSVINNQQNLLSSSSEIGVASLGQNIPNPFNNTTTISYTLPKSYSSALIMITDQSGKVLKQVAVNGSGKGTSNVEGSTLSSGAYSYSLIVDGRLIDTKKMVLAK